jgi:hypothetical protein
MLHKPNAAPVQYQHILLLAVSEVTLISKLESIVPIQYTTFLLLTLTEPEVKLGQLSGPNIV